MPDTKNPPPGTAQEFFQRGGSRDRNAVGMGLRQALAPTASLEAFLTKNPNLDAAKIKKAAKDYVGFGFDAAVRKGKIAGRKALMDHLKANRQSEDFTNAVMRDFDAKIISQKSDIFGKGDEMMDRGFGGHVGGKSDHATQTSRMVDLYRPKSKSYLGKGIKGDMVRSNVLGAERPRIEGQSNSRLAPVVATGDQRGGLGASSLPPVRKYSPKGATANRKTGAPAGSAQEFFQQGGSRDR
jgi:hypothetical protein